MKLSKLMSLIPIAVAASLLLGGCSAPSSSGGSGGGAGTIDEDVVAAAQELVDQYSGVPDPRAVAALANPVPEDRSLVYIGCPIDACHTLYEDFDAAAASLGWTTQEISPDFTPEAVQSAFDSALQIKPDGIFFVAALPVDNFAPQIQQAKDAGIPVVTTLATLAAAEVGGGSGIAGAVRGAPDYEVAGKVQAAVIIADAAKNGESLDQVAFLRVPQNAAAVISFDAFSAEIEKAGATVVPIDINLADVGTVVPGQVVSELQRNPKISYLAPGDDNLLPGVVDAVLASGLEMPKISGNGNVTPETFKSLEDGAEIAIFVTNQEVEAWAGFDILVRVIAGETDIDRRPLNATFLLTSENMAENEGLVDTYPGMPDSYLEAWGVKP